MLWSFIKKKSVRVDIGYRTYKVESNYISYTKLSRPVLVRFIYYYDKC